MSSVTHISGEGMSREWRHTLKGERNKTKQTKKKKTHDYKWQS